MLYKGILIAAASGKIDGAVAAHNRGGYYFRELGLPNDPNTLEQQSVRAAMTDSMALWPTLTIEQRDAWWDYSKRNPRRNRLGDPRPTGALPEFIRSNVPRKHAELWLSADTPAVSDPPADGVPVDPMPAAFLTDDNEAFTLAWDGTAEFSEEENAAMLLYASDPLALTINFFKSPYTLIGAVEGEAP